MPWPSQRYKVDQIQNHIWVKKKFKDGEGCLQEGAGSSKRLCNGTGSLSQPLPADSDRDAASEAGEAEQEAEHPSFTQPNHLEHLLMSTQDTTQSTTQSSRPGHAPPVRQADDQVILYPV